MLEQVSAAEIDSPRPYNGPTAAISVPDDSKALREQDESSTGLVGARIPEAA